MPKDVLGHIIETISMADAPVGVYAKYPRANVITYLRQNSERLDKLESRT